MAEGTLFVGNVEVLALTDGEGEIPPHRLLRAALAAPSWWIRALAATPPTRGSSRPWPGGVDGGFLTELQAAGVRPGRRAYRVLLAPAPRPCQLRPATARRPPHSNLPQRPLCDASGRLGGVFKRPEVQGAMPWSGRNCWAPWPTWASSGSTGEQALTGEITALPPRATPPAT